MGKSIGDVGDSYIEPMPVKEMPSRLSLMARATKDLEAEQLDYDSILNGERSGHPSMRDQEYLEHSSLFGKFYYLNPSNPCVSQNEIAMQAFEIQYFE